MEIRKISNHLSVSPQICVDDVALIKEAGYVAIVNNRPDGEEEDQPWNEDIEKEAMRLGIPYHFVPVTTVPFAAKMIARTQDILEKYEGPIFFFCRTGTRCTHLWAVSQKGKVSSDELISLAGSAGYDITHMAKELS